MLDPKPKFVTFDCYGTLIRMQFSDYAREMLADRIPAERMDQFLQDFSGYRIDEVLGPWKPYADVIHNSLERCCRRYGVRFDPAEAKRMSDDVPTWGPHPDVVAPLTRLGKEVPLVILSNAMNDQIGQNVEKLGATFHAVFTAEQAQSYKPRMQGFEYMFDKLGARPEECMHVSSSLRYDHITARDLGYHYRVFINRGHEPVIPDYVTHQVNDIGGLAALFGL